MIVNEDNAHDTKDFLSKRLEAVKNSRNAGDFEELALVIGELLGPLFDKSADHL